MQVYPVTKLACWLLSYLWLAFLFNDHPKPDNQFIYSQPSAHAHSGFTSWCGRHFHALFFPINNFIYWLTIHLLIGTATSALFPYLMVNFSLKTSAPEKTAQLSGLSQTGGYILAAFGPTLFGYSFDLFHSWVPAVAALLLIYILMTVALFTVDRADKIL